MIPDVWKEKKVFHCLKKPAEVKTKGKAATEFKTSQSWECVVCWPECNCAGLLLEQVNIPAVKATFPLSSCFLTGFCFYNRLLQNLCCKLQFDITWTALFLQQRFAPGLLFYFIFFTQGMFTLVVWFFCHTFTYKRKIIHLVLILLVFTLSFLTLILKIEIKRLDDTIWTAYDIYFVNLPDFQNSC